MTSAPFTLTSLALNYLHMASARGPIHWSLLVEMAPSGDRLTAAALRERTRSRSAAAVSRSPLGAISTSSDQCIGHRAEAMCR